ncbi:MAG: septum formation initiator family protein [Candidatus Staskawiczbacteria bacterium]|jgi:cell division protein FtsB
MVSRFRKTEKREHSSTNVLGIVAAVVILGIVGFLLVTNIEIKGKKDKLNAQIEIIKKQIAALQGKNDSLQEGIASVGDEAYIERVAREELSLQKPGEKVASFILPPQQEEVKSDTKFWQGGYWRQWFGSKWQWVKGIF